MRTEPKDKLMAYKRKVITSLEEMVAKFPESPFAPAAHSQIGTMWTILEEPEKASEALEMLKQKFPDSPEAKNAVFTLARNLLELGRKQQAVRLFKEMFGDSGGKYTDGQILMAGTELAKAKEYEIALIAFKRVIAKAKKRGLLEPAMMRAGECYVNLEQYPETVEVLSKMLDTYKGSGFTVEACMMLSSGLSEVAMKEPDPDKRFDMFNEAVKRIKQARKYAKSKAMDAQSSVIIAQIFLLKAEAEKKHGDPPDEEVVKKYQDQAVATLQILIMMGDPKREPTTAPSIEEAYFRCMPILLDLNKPDDALRDCEDYADKFPGGKYSAKMRKFKSQAKMKVIMLGDSGKKKDEEEAGPQIRANSEPDPIDAPATTPAPPTDVEPEKPVAPAEPVADVAAKAPEKPAEKAAEKAAPKTDVKGE